jgi:hypothetical protein
MYLRILHCLSNTVKQENFAAANLVLQIYLRCDIFASQCHIFGKIFVYQLCSENHLVALVACSIATQAGYRCSDTATNCQYTAFCDDFFAQFRVFARNEFEVFLGGFFKSGNSPLTSFKQIRND